MSYLFLNRWTKFPLMLLVSVILMYSWIGFKHIIEPRFFPVVADFKINKFEVKNDTLFISGVMTKARDCKFESVTIYDNALRSPKLLDVRFLDTPSYTPSRDEGFQAWGVWAVTPASRNIIITARHECSTGTVKTVLFDGVL